MPGADPPSMVGVHAAAGAGSPAFAVHPDRPGAQWLSFPWESTLLNLVAALVGVYVGLATGLLANAVALTQAIFFRTGEVLRLVTFRDPAFLPEFERQLLTAQWHLEFAGLALGVVGLSRLLRKAASTGALPRLPLLEKQQFSLLTGFLGFGLFLYFPLVALASFTRAFAAIHGGMIGDPSGGTRLAWLLVPAFGGAAVGFLLRQFPEAGGHGVREVIHAADSGEPIRGRTALTKPLVAGIVLGTGGSCGREGPVVQMGGAVGSELGRRLGLSARQLRTLLAAGAAAGIAASFNAPIAGSMFALEIVLGDIGVESFSPVVVAAVTATLTARALVGAGGEIPRLTYQLVSPVETLAYAVLGTLCGLAAVLYVRALRASERFFAGEVSGRLGQALRRVPPVWRPALGGVCVGLIGLFVPQALGNGYETMNAALFEELGLGALALIFVAKLLTTGATLGSGAPGGSFFPAVFLGAMLGGAFGRILHLLLPHLTATSGAYAAVGMGALVAGATAAPLTGILMIFELTGNYQAVLPLMVACGLAAAVSSTSPGGLLYRRRVPREALVPKG